MNSTSRLGLLLAAQLALAVVFLACGSDDSKTPGDEPGDEPSGSVGGLKLLFNPMYSAFDGEHTFQLPVKVDQRTGATWKVSDPSKVDIAETTEGATLTMRGAGKVTVTANIGSESGSAELTITQATADQWRAGEARYNNGKSAFKGDAGVSADAGTGFIDFEGACTTCHGATAQTLRVEHTPLQAGGYSDEQLLTIITMGDKPEGARQRSGIPSYLWGRGHRWVLTDAERTGIVVYLRSLAPKSQEGFDFPVRITDAGIFSRDGSQITFPRRDGGGDSGGGGDAASTTDAEVEDEDASAPSADDAGSDAGA